jgi:hypothetical protein
LEIWKKQINLFLGGRLKLLLHSEKSRIIALSRGVDFVGFRIFYYFKLLRKGNIKTIKLRIDFFNKGYIRYEKFVECFNGWNAYSKWADSFNLSSDLIKSIVI